MINNTIIHGKKRSLPERKRLRLDSPTIPVDIVQIVAKAAKSGAYIEHMFKIAGS